MRKLKRIKELQQGAIELEKEIGKLNYYSLILHGDFAENWSLAQKNAIQGFHWTNREIYKFTYVRYIRKITETIGVVSDGRWRDSAIASELNLGIFHSRQFKSAVQKITNSPNLRENSRKSIND